MVTGLVADRLGRRRRRAGVCYHWEAARAAAHDRLLTQAFDAVMG